MNEEIDRQFQEWVGTVKYGIAFSMSRVDASIGFTAGWFAALRSTEGKKIKCEVCENGEVWTECCNGSGDCPCEGRQVFYGQCAVCDGTGQRDANADTQANLRALRRTAVADGGYIGNPHGRLR